MLFFLEIAALKNFRHATEGQVQAQEEQATRGSKVIEHPTGQTRPDQQHCNNETEVAGRQHFAGIAMALERARGARERESQRHYYYRYYCTRLLRRHPV